MSTVATQALGQTGTAVASTSTALQGPTKRKKGYWGYTAVLFVITAVALVPIGVTVWEAFTPQVSSTSHATLTWANFSYVFSQTGVFTWLRNSGIVAVTTMLLAICVACPAGYVLSRARSKAINGYALLLFIGQSFPVIVSAIPLFILFSKVNLDDNLIGVAIVYVCSSISVATWMMAAYIDTIPVSLEESGWIDGCSLFGGFMRIVLRNCLPGILSTAIFSFLIAWNDFLIAVVFLRSDSNFTLPLGLETFFAENTTQWGYVMALSVIVMIPPVIIFSFLHKYFSIGGISGALGGH
ncbi:MAG TPA: carbohydrate ABC transporter permease [Acidimicrobiales bacterium]|nr:carbohydrate ABC transporter permease [Acidimicrobiales bacterium]